ncbi:phage major capsid protein, P2 family [Pantoea stewartii]|uniref:Phage major capsid protein n=1 Tax=Pantoea stewartii subsp. stewartii DC283 TaxID=660596 RepID=H3RA26_PANSE|nr:phage major capsid protein, P2 family [Pantoea stewartii]ARF51485.1 phage major capsid protein, P2 family [Pantoea stewartii subsp. stewartii DC283]EHU02039.1 phage major capsid protein [Pantoea stewartii subsp. stewartii DC283]KAB0559720.1 phage major capsid protein, P2 family [Pantoea stewartii subsp. stewartii]
MKNQTRHRFQNWVLHQQNGSEEADACPAQHFSVEPSASQRAVSRMQESSALLGRINIVAVDEQQSEKLGLGVGSPLAATGTASQARREPRPVVTLDSDDYRCEQVNTDTFISFSQLDSWACLDGFEERIESQITIRKALHRIMTGFNGVTHAAKSDIDKNPLLQDVNTGWLQHMRSNASQRIISGVSVSRRDADNRIVSPGDYGTIDSLLMEAYRSLLDPWYVDSEELVVICGRDMLTRKYFPLINGLGTVPAPNREILSWMVLDKNQTLGGLPAFGVPFFPADAALITTFENLSMYWQRNTDRRLVADESPYNRVAIYDSRNEAYVVEDYGCACLVEGIKWGNDGKAS